MEDSLTKTLGRWESSAYLLYVCILRERLAGLSTVLSKYDYYVAIQFMKVCLWYMVRQVKKEVGLMAGGRMLVRIGLGAWGEGFCPSLGGCWVSWATPNIPPQAPVMVRC